MPRLATHRTDETTDALRRDILGGRFRPGDSLPAERELALRLGVSRLTLRAALARLTAEGLVLPQQGAGNRVLDFRDSGRLELVAHLALLPGEDGAPLALPLFEELLELRCVVAAEVFAKLARSASEQTLDELLAHVEAQATLIDDPKAYVRSDIELARRLVRATGSLALELVTASLGRIVERSGALEAAFLANPRGSLAVYRRLLEQARSRRPAQSRTSARRLMTRLDRVLLARLRALTEGT